MDVVKTLHVVGFKNSGKTTLVARWVRLLKEKSLTVAVLKHHGHGGKPEMPDTKTDTMQFLTNGADATLVAGGGAAQLILNEEPDFETLKRMVSLGKPDVLLIEGYKKEFGDKVILLRNQEDWVPLSELQGRQLVIGCPEIEMDGPHIHSREETELIDKWFLEWIGEEDGDEAF
ncbi:molybdopterin-guanine dinucleotide biosynthesis protein B [Sporosarcina highlanderae]|uniref:Molybdopterin-guanine dinucleotide biosynthesis protein B n=1 Tax=Sporosarcina highlanderae TaxID=3035916 RepID=A0ABT8JLU6_9BACL|nr:molybdopterin-guanine dinucleotide biosynthesis protein B [Sporosarcina highlanderae]MDN4606123.1 molybdopterin-guanine dinucleotide biosynthesis protein B [Sporosarcina highlanderae]